LGNDWKVSSYIDLSFDFSYVLCSALFDGGNTAITGKEDFDVMLD